MLLILPATSFFRSQLRVRDYRWGLERRPTSKLKALLFGLAPSSPRRSGAAPLSLLQPHRSACRSPAPSYPQSWTRPWDTWTPLHGAGTPHGRSINRFPAEHHVLRFGGADSHPRCFTLGCKMPQWMPEVTVQGGQQDHIICKQPITDPETPIPDLLHPPASGYLDAWPVLKGSRRRPTPTANVSDLMPRMRTQLLLQAYRVWHPKNRGTRSKASSKSTKHM